MKLVKFYAASSHNWPIMVNPEHVMSLTQHLQEKDETIISFVGGGEEGWVTVKGDIEEVAWKLTILVE